MKKFSSLKKTNLILGIDPGSRHTGYGLISLCGQKITLVEQGCLSPKSNIDIAERLKFIYSGLQAIIERNQPAIMAIEDIFYAKNVKAALSLGYARGTALLIAAQFNIPIFEYPPTLVKNSVAGYGRAEKTQVAHMVKELLGINEKLVPDAADALAVAICHCGQANTAVATLSKKNWRSFSIEDIQALSYKSELK